MINIKKIYTDNPILDELIYQTSKMAVECILKDQNEADQYETLESIKNNDLYNICINNREKYSMFEYEYDDFMNIPTVSETAAAKYVLNPDIIPDSIKATLLQNAKKKFLDNYEELNEYYRILEGLPPLGETGLTLRQANVDLSEIENIPIDLDTPIHKLSAEHKEILDNYNILDAIYDKNKKPYLRHIGKRKISAVKARKALNFSILYIPRCESVEVYTDFVSKLEKNRVFILNTVYSDAYSIGNTYYYKCMIILIIAHTMLDVISNSQQYLIDREVFDLRTVQYILEANNVKFFKDIPLKYQKRLVKNLNRITKYKSTDKNIIDLCSLFGFEDIEVFKYYLYKERKIDESGNYYMETKTIKDPEDDDSTIEVEDDTKNYSLKFIKVPLEDDLDEYIRDTSNHKSYDEITLSDQTWDGPYDHDYVKKIILEREFTNIKSKYMSIDTIIDLTKMSFEMSYFINILMNNTRLDMSKLTIECPSIDSSNSTFNVVDVLVYLYALAYLYNDIDDNIMDTTSKVLYIQGFNFEADIDELSQYVYEQGFTLEELGVSEFKIPTSGIYSFSQLIEIYTNNKNIYDHIVSQLNKISDRKIYSIYKKIYDSLMITKLNHDVYKLPDGNIASTYTDYLKYRNSRLYESLSMLKSMTLESRQSSITAIINNVTESIYDYIGRDFKYVFANLPTVSEDYIKKYLFEVITFFKSYRITLLDIGTIYKISEDFRFPIIDEMIYTACFDKVENIILKDTKKYIVEYLKDEKVAIQDKIYLSHYFLKDLLLESNLSIEDLIAHIQTLYEKTDKLHMKDELECIMYTYLKLDSIRYREQIVRIYSTFDIEDSLRLRDKMYYSTTTTLSYIFDDIYSIRDEARIQYI